MAAASKPNHSNNSRSSDSDIDDTITVILLALAKAVAVVAWWSVLFPMISVPTIASVWVGLHYGGASGVILMIVSGSALAAWSQLWPASFQQSVTQRIRTRWRTWSIYRHRWMTICSLHGLTAKTE